MIDEESLRAYLRAGEVAYRVKRVAESMVKPGVRILDIAEGVESVVRSLGGESAFPTNVSINEIAAHRTPYIGDSSVVPEGSLVKVDIGVHVDGYIADTAITVTFDDKLIRLVEAAREALSRALLSITPGVQANAVGRVIEAVARGYGFNVVRNLSGHSLGRYLIHAGDTIPNHATRIPMGKLVSGKAYAVEPFLTNGRGYVEEIKGFTQIYVLTTNVKSLKRVEGDETQLVNSISRRFRTLPFCERWLKDEHADVERLRMLLQKLVRKSVVVGYPVLKEVSNGFVAQFEETVLIHEKDVIVTTNPELSR